MFASIHPDADFELETVSGPAGSLKLRVFDATGNQKPQVFCCSAESLYPTKGTRFFHFPSLPGIVLRR